jgi:hypothetical protein
VVSKPSFILFVAYGGRPFVMLLEFYIDTEVEHTAGKVVGYGILVVLHVCDPIISAYVVEAEDIQAIQA